MSSVEVDNAAPNEGAEKTGEVAESKPTAHVLIRRSDMPIGMQKEAIAIIVETMQTVTLDKDAATKIKQAFDARFQKSTWHCVVGKHFAASITHQTGYQLFISVDGHNIMLFKSQD